MALGWILGGLVALIAGVGFVQHRQTRGTYTPLARRQPERRDTATVPLGMEAIDMSLVNAANRRNESLERGQMNWMSRGSMGAATDVAPMADDETYAKQYYTAFNTDLKKPKDRRK